MTPAADPSSPPVRLAHFSDIHLTARPLGWRLRHLFSKRTTGWVHLKIGRGRRFRFGPEIVRAMMADIRERGGAHAVFSGDATTLGFEAEFAAAAQCLDLDLPGLAVPGNHDYYTKSVVSAGLFERYFARWQGGERIGADTYPFAQKVGHCWLIAVQSARANFLLWDARGEIDAGQRQRLRDLLKRLSAGPRILVTHYPLFLETGQPEDRWRLLRQWQTFRDLLVEGGISLYLHGHRHGRYMVPADADRPFPIICAGSATQAGRWSWNEYIIEGSRLSINRRTWHAGERRFVEAENRVTQLP